MAFIIFSIMSYDVMECPRMSNKNMVVWYRGFFIIKEQLLVSFFILWRKYETTETEKKKL